MAIQLSENSDVTDRLNGQYLCLQLTIPTLNVFDEPYSAAVFPPESLALAFAPALRSVSITSGLEFFIAAHINGAKENKKIYQTKTYWKLNEALYE